MRFQCPGCHCLCDIDVESADSMTCPSCGWVLSTEDLGLGEIAAVTLPNTPAVRPDPVESAWDREPTQSFQRPPGISAGFEIRGLLGEGGFARVYRAYDRKLDREVAIKVSKQDPLSGPAAWQAMRHEARTAAKLQHPNIVRILHVPEQADRELIIVMEYIAGPSLREQLKNAATLGQRFPQQRAVEIVAEVADALHYAHKAGLVHRDLTPANILLDATGRAHVTDFGIAVHEDLQRCRAGEVAGTLPYMSPEQVRGETHHLDGRCDIWALGVILYELLAGRRPFGGTPEQLRQEILQRAPKPLRQIDDKIPVELERICLKCLSKSVSDRHATAQDVLVDLRAWQGRVSSAPAAPLRPFVSWRRVGVLTIVLLALGGGTWAALSNLQSDRDRETADPFPPRYLAFRDLDGTTPRKWLPVLDRRPMRFCWYDVPGAMSSFDDQREVLLMSSGTLGLLGVGRTAAPAFRTQVTLVKSNPVGNAGVFLGATPSTVAGQHRWSYQSIFVQTDEFSGTTIRRRQSVLSVHGTDVLPESHDEFAQVKVEPLGTKEHLLEVIVAGDLVWTVKWDGRELERLTDNALLAERTGWQPPTCRGAFGVVNYDGATMFRDYRFWREER